ncbi:hypothetical protein THRCLA_11489 [Thraustotheca clavata]|uniref:Dynein heavy chain coiled coil stalk domain-containing protein n=1 Tax=Thraustotheca clavata TaxID=74557 RepID=A0A1V9Y7K0_9STRA|nr:hypothetical protein THRCLA_11489 [Thraustotheca clavata]
MRGIAASSEDIEALAQISDPPRIMSFVLTIVYILVTPGMLAPNDISWFSLQQFYSHGDSVLRRLRKCSELKDSPNFDMKCAMLAPFLQQESFTSDPLFQPESLASSSVGLAALCTWMLDVMNGKDKDSIELMNQLDEEVVNQQEAELGWLLHQGTWICHSLEYTIILALSHRTKNLIVDIAAQAPGDSRLRVELTVSEVCDIFGMDVASAFSYQDWVSMCDLIVARLDMLAAMDVVGH